MRGEALYSKLNKMKSNNLTNLFIFCLFLGNLFPRRRIEKKIAHLMRLHFAVWFALVMDSLLLTWKYYLYFYKGRGRGGGF